MTELVKFPDVYGIEFGQPSQAGSAAPVNAFNMRPYGLKGQASHLTISADVDGEELICAGHLGSDAVQFATTQHMVDLATKSFKRPSGAQVNIIRRLTKLRDNAGADAWFPFFSFSTMNLHNAYPKQGRPLTPGKKFFVTAMDKHGSEVTIECVFQMPANGATFSRVRFRPELFYIASK